MVKQPGIMSRPQVVSAEEWHAASAALLVKEKEHTRAPDALAAERRRLPMVAIDTDKYRFTAPDGNEVGLTDLFDGHLQLIIYHFMLEPGQDWLCGGCCTFTDNLDNQAQPHLSARGTRLILMARAPQQEIEPLRQRMGWGVPWYSATAPTSTTTWARAPSVSACCYGTVMRCSAPTSPRHAGLTGSGSTSTC